MNKTFITVGSVFMFLAVAAGAFGAHGLTNYFVQFPQLQETFETAVQYQMIHALGLFAAAWVAGFTSSKLASWAGYLFVAGIILFSGSLFLLVVTQVTWLGAITPIGGLAFLVGWLLLGLSPWRASNVDEAKQMPFSRNRP